MATSRRRQTAQATRRVRDNRQRLVNRWEAGGDRVRGGQRRDRSASARALALVERVRDLPVGRLARRSRAHAVFVKCLVTDLTTRYAIDTERIYVSRRERNHSPR